MKATTDTEVLVEQSVDQAVDNLLDSVNMKNIVLYNDEVNTFEWVINCLIKYCEHQAAQAEQCALIVHTKGKCAVKNGTREKLKPILDALIENGLMAKIE